jgi:hypothetical protein
MSQEMCEDCNRHMIKKIIPFVGGVIHWCEVCNEGVDFAEFTGKLNWDRIYATAQ